VTITAVCAVIVLLIICCAVTARRLDPFAAAVAAVCVAFVWIIVDGRFRP
jgi:hypothetical protein